MRLHFNIPLSVNKHVRNIYRNYIGVLLYDSLSAELIKVLKADTLYIKPSITDSLFLDISSQLHENE